MASNPIPDRESAVLSMAEDMADGLHQHEAAVAVKQNTETVVRAAIAALRTTQGELGAAQGAKSTLSTNLRIADSNATAFLRAARKVLTEKISPDWTQAWEPTGFPDNSTAVPDNQEARMDLCSSLQNYFTNTPAHEVAPLDVTAAIAGQRFTALSDARHAMDDGLSVCGQKKNVKNAALVALKRRMRGLITELETLLEDDDPRWRAFGLNAPADPDTPDIPEALVLLAGVAGSILADWSDARRADRYRVWLQIVGVDTEFRAVMTVNDSDATITGLTSGQTVRVRITAVNEQGDESQPSETKEIVVP
jgi:hypothetical protein